MVHYNHDMQFNDLILKAKTIVCKFAQIEFKQKNLHGQQKILHGLKSETTVNKNQSHI